MKPPLFASLWILLLSSILLPSQTMQAADYSQADFQEEFVFDAGTFAYEKSNRVIIYK